MGNQRLDITGTLSPDMWSYRAMIPDMPRFEQRRFATIPEQGWEADWFAMPTLAGTYLETAKHLIGDRLSIDQVPIDDLFVRATIATIPKQASEHITVSDLESAVTELEPGDALLVSTGWERHWWDDGSVFVGQSPHYDLSAMQWIVDRNVSILGGDFPCYDDPVTEQGQNVNMPLFESGALILAPLVNLAKWSSHRAMLTVLPIPLKGACGAPCRAILSPIEGAQE
ncbi:cyclase family protein [soil metagenome]